jgi:hypothetical protein
MIRLLMKKQHETPTHCGGCGLPFSRPDRDGHATLHVHGDYFCNQLCADTAPGFHRIEQLAREVC